MFDLRSIKFVNFPKKIIGSFPALVGKPAEHVLDRAEHTLDLSEHIGNSKKHVGKWLEHVGNSAEHIGNSSAHVGNSPKRIGNSKKHVGNASAQTFRASEHIGNEKVQSPAFGRRSLCGKPSKEGTLNDALNATLNDFNSRLFALQFENALPRSAHE